MTTDLEGLSTEQLRELLRDGDCWGVADPDRWFPPEPRSGFPEQRRAYEHRAAQLCGGCPVKTACLEYALRVEATGAYPHGVWGGTAPWQRRQMIAVRRATSIDDWRAVG